MPKSSSKKKAEAMQLETQKIANEKMKADIARQNEIYGRIAPFAQMLTQFGIDPIKFLQSPQGSALLAPVRQEIGASFDQARQNLVDIGAGAGFSTGSGQLTGPLANMFSAEAGAQASALQQLIAQSLGLGMQGANILQGQQAIFNPAQIGTLGVNAGQSILSQPPSGILPAIIGAAGTALGGYLGGQGGQGSSAAPAAGTGYRNPANFTGF